MNSRPFDPNRFNPQPKKEKVDKIYKGIAKVSPKQMIKNDAKKDEVKEHLKFYKEWWENHPNHCCYECGEQLLFHTPSNTHHLISKKDQDKYSVDITFNTELLVLLCFMDHSKVEVNIDFAPRVKQLTEETLNKFEQYLK